jgi:ferredoxin
MNRVRRKIIHIDEELCDGCGNCIPGCPEQALQIIETPHGPKAKLVKELYCDGLGACLGTCPTGALTVVEDEAEPYNEEATIARIKEKAPEILETHMKHLKEHAALLPEHHTQKIPKVACACPSTQVMEWKEKKTSDRKKVKIATELRQWPVQIHLVPPSAPYLKNADIAIIADCVPFAYADLHQDFLKGKAVLVGCPKLDDVDYYIEKIAQIIEHAKPRSIQIVHMEVPCCFGLMHIIREAKKRAGSDLPVEEVTVSIKGEVI